MEFDIVWLRTVLYVLALGLFGFTIWSTFARNGVRTKLGLAGLVCGLLAIPFVWAQEFAVVWAAFLTLTIMPTLVDAGRMYAARFNDQSKSHSARLDSFALLVLFAAGALWAPSVSNLAVVTFLTGASLILAIYGVFRVAFAYRRFRFPAEPTGERLPAITLAIPARNETQSLSECLMAAHVSDYKKMEIMVLDDCSQDRTSQVIRSFAQDGVQFIQGDAPSDGWLGKNFAMRQLAKQANGEYVVFMNVDTRISPQTLTKLMSVMTSRKLDMISVLPRRNYAWHFSGIMETLRYFWQVILPPTSFRTPVASSLWIIRREKLEELGGFASQKHKILPENHFARQLIAAKKYRFFIDAHDLGVSDAKKWTSSAKTSVRLLYPTLHRHPLEALGNILLHATLLTPYILVMLAIVNQSFGILFYMCAVACILLCFMNMLYALLIRSSWPLAFLTFPLQLLQEIIITFISVLAYEFGDIEWKGRNVCYPVMQSPRKS